MYKIRMLVFNFGKMSNYFELWLKTVASNPSIDFLIITDEKNDWDIPNNVEIITMTLDEMIECVKKNSLM